MTYFASLFSSVILPFNAALPHFVAFACATYDKILLPCTARRLWFLNQQHVCVQPFLLPLRTATNTNKYETSAATIDLYVMNQYDDSAVDSNPNSTTSGLELGMAGMNLISSNSGNNKNTKVKSRSPVPNSGDSVQSIHSTGTAGSLQNDSFVSYASARSYKTSHFSSLKAFIG